MNSRQERIIFVIGRSERPVFLDTGPYASFRSDDIESLHLTGAVEIVKRYNASLAGNGGYDVRKSKKTDHVHSTP